jgi:hypothetical protein
LFHGELRLFLLSEFCPAQQDSHQVPWSSRQLRISYYDFSMKFKGGNAKDRQILVGLTKLSLPERFKRLLDLTLRIQMLEESNSNKKSGSRTQKQRRGILADEDGLIELKRRFTLEKAEYLAIKEITPDYEEPR